MSSARQASAFARFWNSPTGPKTVHFWAPVMKWGLVIAGIGDLQRPASQLSMSQNLALTATGTIWTRWSFVIKPKNYLLATVNFFLACTGTTQVTRILLWRREQERIMAEESTTQTVAAASAPQPVVSSSK